ncbi:SDR family NAD(P)-dependent oxidoreductase [Actinoplanes sp. TBRC 11911]|uniref:SDR family NAD(P)-dependent oxidoreductase n=1 Tax=Actinoplanes sp. TBRC 11911 TaxID=2729386 RepID=UPI00145C95DA|nr:SDR family NAD(P)-dependent oxidoreductase [Actinoplanes sp. TBRC 11911]NMO49682.1 SDR family NAD(P)-dependent oxidoreductase [Actinoplanes sp. TBRC 11911]
MTNTWFITGASAGIGRELVRQALEAGENVTAIARNTAGLSNSGRLLAISADVTDEAAVRDAVAQTVARFGRIDYVANNAGYGLVGAVEEATDAKARAIFDTNVFGVLNVLRATLPVLREQRSGRILQGSSFLGQTAAPGVGFVSATKYAVEGLSDALALETAPLGIKVTLIQPGVTATSFFTNLDAPASTLDDYDQTVRAPQPAVAAAPVERVVAAIREVAVSENPPRRLALGTAFGEAMRTALTDRLADLDTWAKTTSSVDA